MDTTVSLGLSETFRDTRRQMTVSELTTTRTFLVYVGVGEDDTKGVPFYREATSIEDANERTSAIEDNGFNHVLRDKTVDYEEKLLEFRELRAKGHEVVVSHKRENGAYGPITVADKTAASRDPKLPKNGIGMPYGYDPPWQLVLPYGGITEARRVSRAVGCLGNVRES